MPAGDSGEKASRLEEVLLLVALGFYAIGLPMCGAIFRPGFAAYDEESFLDQIQAWREGHPLILRFGLGSLYRGLGVLLVQAGGPHLFLLRLPALAAVLAEACLLYFWLRDKIGERGALWAALADLVCTATFARGASLLAASLMPAAFLLGVVACERLRRPWQSALWGLAVGFMLLDYEGWAGALLFLVPYAAWLWRERPGLRPAAAFGLVAAGTLVLGLSPDLLKHIQARGALSSPDAGFISQAWTNLRLLLSRGDRMAISAAANQPWPSPWIWPLLVLGAWPAFRRFPWLAWLLACGSLALGLVDTNFEPHRLCLALLALGACAGAGASLLWKSRWGRVLCLALLAWGASSEIRAWNSMSAAKLQLTYASSVELEQSALWLAQHQPAGGWDVISGLGSHDDGAFRFLLDQAGVEAHGKTPVALIYWDYQPGLKALAPGRAVVLGDYQPVLLFLPQAKDAARLDAVSASLRGLRWALVSQSPSVVQRLDALWLQAKDPAHQDPWARTVVWEQWLFSSLLLRKVDLDGVEQMLKEPMVCGWAPDVLAKELQPSNPALAQRLREKAEAIDPRRKAMSQEQRIARY
ncbi:MAG TPA: hypothetical protein VK914_00455 [bacterium]|jgi:hypothetical protein|nr:hypothetical protein [bacterium]